MHARGALVYRKESTQGEGGAPAAAAPWLSPRSHAEKFKVPNKPRRYASVAEAVGADHKVKAAVKA